MKSNWIPVSEKLPENSGEYLVTTKLARAGIMMFSAKHKKFNTYDRTSDEDAKYFAISVIAWMPLPEPYRAN